MTTRPNLLAALAALAAIVALALPSAPAQEPDGEVLLAQLGCTSCHTADAATLARLRPQRAPELAEVGRRLSYSALRARALGHGLMPDVVHGRGAAEQQELASAIASFLGSTTGTLSAAPTGVDATTIERGKTLFDSIGCRACHGDALEERDLATATTIKAMVTFLMDPLLARPSGRMPGMHLSRDETAELAAYLLRGQVGDGVGTAPGLWAEAFHLSQPGDNPDLDALEPVWRGVAETPTVAEVTRHDDVGLRFTGSVRVPAAGEWTFFTTSDDGSRLWIGDELVVQNDGHHPMVERSGTITLAAGTHPITVTFFQALGGLGLEVGWEGPGTTKQLIPASAYGHRAALFVPPLPAPRPTATAVERGRLAFGDLGCAACHELEGTRWPGGAPPLVELAGDSGGCLAAAPALGLPAYTLTDAERRALVATLRHPDSLREPPAPARAVELTMGRLGCAKCHRRDGQAGPEGAARDCFTSTTDLGDEGRIPPDLTGVGARLTPEGITAAMLTRASDDYAHDRLRPHMLTRMPAFDPAQVEPLVALFTAADAREPLYSPREFRAEDVALGRRLVGTTGLACITCHGFGGSPAIGTPGIDLLRVPGRVRHDWFHRHVWQPTAGRPETRMPTFWNEAVRLFPELTGGGDPHVQIDAIWTYLSLGAAAPPPVGIAPSGDEYELVPIERPILFGTFMQGLSARTITVGYPERVHVAFDAHGVRLAKVWRGRFMNAMGTWQGRAGQLSQPAGDDGIDLPPGAALAVLATRADPWPSTSGREAGWRMVGHTLDAAGHPTFDTRLGDSLLVHETPSPVLAAGGGSLLRRFQVEATADLEAGALYLRAAVGEAIEHAPDAGFHVTQGTRVLRIRTPPDAFARPAPGGMELLVPVTPGTPCEVEVTW